MSEYIVQVSGGFIQQVSPDLVLVDDMLQAGVFYHEDPYGVVDEIKKRIGKPLGVPAIIHKVTWI